MVLSANNYLVPYCVQHYKSCCCWAALLLYYCQYSSNLLQPALRRWL